MKIVQTHTTPHRAKSYHLYFNGGSRVELVAMVQSKLHLDTILFPTLRDSIEFICAYTHEQVEYERAVTDGTY